MRRVIVESPFAAKRGSRQRNVDYARRAVRDCLQRGEAPLASHLLYTQPGILKDSKPDERTLGITAGLTWGKLADAIVVYEDLGISAGMQIAINYYTGEGIPIERRSLNGKA
jgi:hypothetical protein